jgi:hypothetical protein
MTASSVETSSQSLLFTLILTGGAREAELQRFLDSLSSVTIPLTSIQLVFVNQSTKSIYGYRSSTSGFLVNEVFVQPCSLSKARNIGLSIACGIFIMFPDDDCWYPPSIFTDFLNRFNSLQSVACICGSVFDPYLNKPYGNRPLKLFTSISYHNILLPISVGIAVRRSALQHLPTYFNEQYGAGTPLGSGEETDLLDRLLNLGHNIVYDGRIIVYHELEKCSSPLKSYRYGVGFGHLCFSRLCEGNFWYALLLAKIVFYTCVGFIVRLPFSPGLSILRMVRLFGIFIGCFGVLSFHSLEQK